MIVNMIAFLFYHSLNIPIYLMNGIKLGKEILEVKNAENEYLKRKEIAEKTKNEIIATSNLLSFL